MQHYEVLENALKHRSIERRPDAASTYRRLVEIHSNKNISFDDVSPPTLPSAVLAETCLDVVYVGKTARIVKGDSKKHRNMKYHRIRNCFQACVESNVTTAEAFGHTPCLRCCK